MSLPELCVKRRSVHEDEKGLQGVSVDGCAEISFLLLTKQGTSLIILITSSI